MFDSKQITFTRKEIEEIFHTTPELGKKIDLLLNDQKIPLEKVVYIRIYLDQLFRNIDYFFISFQGENGFYGVNVLVRESKQLNFWKGAYEKIIEIDRWRKFFHKILTEKTPTTPMPSLPTNIEDETYIHDLEKYFQDNKDRYLDLGEADKCFFLKGIKDLENVCGDKVEAYEKGIISQDKKIEDIKTKIARLQDEWNIILSKGRTDKNKETVDKLWDDYNTKINDHKIEVEYDNMLHRRLTIYIQNLSNIKRFYDLFYKLPYNP